MPVRKIPLVNNYYYHIFNRSIAKVPIFISKSDFLRALAILNYYRFEQTPLSFSELKRLNKEQQIKIIKDLEKKADCLVEIIAFCLMPNHFHFLLKQIKNKGIERFLSKIQNSYAKYFNAKYQRTGSLFQNRFKAILVEDDYQLLHLSRYIHLNPYSSLIIRKKEQLFSYFWSSFLEYLGKKSGFCQPKIVLERFKNPSEYKGFVFDQADYQRDLEKIKHLILER